MAKYQEYIMEILRQRLGLQPDDTSKDYEIACLTPNEVFTHVLEWEGIIGYEYKMKMWIRDIYGVFIS